MPTQVTILTGSTRSGGGASRVGNELAEGLRGDSAFEVRHTLGYPVDPVPPRAKALWAHPVRRWVQRSGAKLTRRLCLPDVLLPSTPGMLTRFTNTDILHIHDGWDLISPLTFPVLSRQTRLVWTLHDCGFFTSGCVYPRGCTKYETTCRDCPQVGTWPLNAWRDNTHLMYLLKAALYRKSSVTLIAPSEWMAAMAERSGLVDEKPDVIHCGVDLDRFALGDATLIRDQLELPQNDFIVLVSCAFDNERKGARFIVDAIRRSGIECTVVAIGHVDPQFKADLEGIGAVVRGFIHDPTELARYFCAADVFLFPTLADNCPVVVLEALAASTPVVAFGSGGVPELIEHGASGWLAPPEDVDALAAGLRQSRKKGVAKGWGHAARSDAERRFGLDAFTNKHKAVYKRLITESSRHG